jgi:hypothetical protein
MIMSDAKASVLGFAFESPVSSFPAREGPGTSFPKTAFMANKDTNNLTVLDVQPDSQGTKSDFGRVYQWFKLQFSDGQTGWMRGHVVGIQGDFSAYGYGVVKELTHAYTLVRDMTAVKTSTESVASSKTDTTTMRAVNPLAAAAQAQREAQATGCSNAWSASTA